MIKPAVVDSQIDGGTVQGIGGAVYDHAAYDEDGKLVTTTFHSQPLSLPRIVALLDDARSRARQ